MADFTPSRFSSLISSYVPRILPDWFRAMFLGMPIATRIHFSDRSISLTEGDQRVHRPSAARTSLSDAAALQQGQVVDAVVPQRRFLKRRISAPKTAANSLAAVAQLDLQRRTPLQVSAVKWILGTRHRSETQIVAEQWVAKMTDLALWKTQLEETGVKVRRFFIEGVEEFGPIADYSSDIAPQARRWKLLNGMLLLAVLCSAISWWLYPAWALGPQLRAMEKQITQLRDEALQLRPHIEQLRGYNAEKTAFLDVMNRQPVLSETLRELTIALPDAVWLESLTFTKGRLVFSGETQQSAPQLVLDLAENVRFQTPRLTGAVSNTQSGAERFEITLELSEKP